MIKKTVVSLFIPILLISALYSPATFAGHMVEKGKEIAFDRQKGNCLACHRIDDGILAGNIGPPLIAMKARFPNRDSLTAQIYNPLAKNPHSVMPPFGLHHILSTEEIDAIVDYLLTL